MREYLLSVIIPTKNRQYYCLNSVKQILDCYGNDVEIVVQDNSDEPILREQIAELKRDNIVYQYCSGTLSFVDNFDKAISLSSGKYLMLIGDDDGVTSLALKAVKWAEKEGISSIKPSLSFVYFWPNSKVFKNRDNGVLNIYEFDGSFYDYNPLDGVKDLLGNSCQNYLENDLIKLYHGIVSRELLGKIKKTTGKYVGGLSPDIYLSVALSTLSEGKAVSINAPMSISGICTGSGSSQSATGEHTGKLEDAPHFRGHENYEWDRRIPKFYSVETIWADSAMAAVKEINPDYERYYHSETLTYRCLRKYPQFKYEIMKAYLSNDGNRFSLYKYALSRVYNKLTSKLCCSDNSSIKKTYDEVETIVDAAKYCELWLQNQCEAIETIFESD